MLRFALFGLLALALSASLTFPDASPKVPKAAGWVKMQTENFTLFSNANAGKTRKIAIQLERFREVLGRSTKGFNFEATVPTKVFVFKNPPSFEPFAPKSATPKETHAQGLQIGGYFLERPFANYIAMDASRDQMVVIYHEYVHSLLHLNFESLPQWLNEGLAEYYSTFRFNHISNIAEIGRHNPWHVPYLNEYGLLPLDRMFEVTNRSSTYRGGNKQGIFYAQSWLLVHYLMEGDRKSRFGHYLGRLRAGEDPDGLLERVLEKPRKQLESELTEHVNDTSGFYRLTLAEDIEKAVVTVAKMERGETLYELGNLLAERGEKYADLSRAYLHAALEAGGPVSSIHSSLGLATRHASRDESRQWYEKAIGSGGADAETYARFGFLLLECEGCDAPRSTGTGDVPEDVQEARRLFSKSLDLEPDNVEALAGLGASHLYDADPAQALAVLGKANSLRPFRTDILYNLVLAMAASGRSGAALSVIDRKLRPKVDDLSIPQNAEAWVAATVAERATAKALNDDVAGALELLASTARRVRDPSTRENLEKLHRRLSDPSAGTPVTIDAADAERANEIIETYNQAGKLAAAGNVPEALELLASAVEGCGASEVCDAARELEAKLRKLAEHNQRVAAYNEAVQLVNTGKFDEAAAKLNAIEDPVEDADLGRAIEELKRKLASR